MSWATKYRPKKFDGVVGQESAVALLQRSVEMGDRQCVLLAGPYGTGKTTLARAYARELGVKPAGVMYTELDAATHSGVDSVRNLLEQAQYAFGDTQVIVIDEAQALSTAAQQAFLVAIEEGSPADFIFCSSNPEKLNPALKSRLLPCYLKPVRREEIEERLRIIAVAEGIPYDAAGLAKLAVRSQGHLRDAITALETLQNAEEYVVDRFVGANLQGRIVDAVACTCEERVELVKNLLTELAPSELADRMATLIIEAFLADHGCHDGVLTDEDRAHFVRVIKELSWTNPFGVATRLFELRGDLPDLYYGVAAICYAFEKQETQRASIPTVDTSMPRKPGT